MTYAWDARALLLLVPGCIVALAVRGTTARRAVWGVTAAAGLPAAAVLPWAMLGVYSARTGVASLLLLTIGVVGCAWYDRRRQGPDREWRLDVVPNVATLALLLPLLVFWTTSHPWPLQWNSHYTLALQCGEWIHRTGAFPSLADVGARYTNSPALYPPLLHATSALVSMLGRNALVTWAALAGKLGLLGLAFGLVELVRSAKLPTAAHTLGVAVALAFALNWGPHGGMFFLVTELNQDTLLVPIMALVLCESLRMLQARTPVSSWPGWLAVGLVGWVRQPQLPFALAWWLLVCVLAHRRWAGAEATRIGRQGLRLLLGAGGVTLLGLGWSGFLWVRYGSPLYPFRFGSGLLRGLYPFDVDAWQFFQGPGVALYSGSAVANLLTAVAGPPGWPLWRRLVSGDGFVVPGGLLLATAAGLHAWRPAVACRPTKALVAWVLLGVAYCFLLPGRGTIKPFYMILPALYALTALGAGRGVQAFSECFHGRGARPAWFGAAVMFLSVWGNGLPHYGGQTRWYGWLHPPRSLQAAIAGQYGAPVSALLNWMQRNGVTGESAVLFNNEHAGLPFFWIDATPIWSIPEYRVDLYPWHQAKDLSELQSLMIAAGRRWLFAPDRTYLDKWITTSPQIAMAPELLVHHLRNGTLGYTRALTVPWHSGVPIVIYDLHAPTGPSTTP